MFRGWTEPVCEAARGIARITSGIFSFHPSHPTHWLHYSQQKGTVCFSCVTARFKQRDFAQEGQMWSHNCSWWLPFLASLLGYLGLFFFCRGMRSKEISPDIWEFWITMLNISLWLFNSVDDRIYHLHDSYSSPDLISPVGTTSWNNNTEIQRTVTYLDLTIGELRKFLIYLSSFFVES